MLPNDQHGETDLVPNNAESHNLVYTETFADINDTLVWNRWISHSYFSFAQGRGGQLEMGSMWRENKNT